MRRKVPRLANVQDPQGRVDVALYRLASKAIERLELEQGLVGMREHVLPIIEDAILRNFPAENLIPREIQAVLKVCELNRGRGM
jgi:hypothetical protein